jgi:hypothetical protein
MESINQTGDSLPPPDFAVSASASFAPATYLTAIAVCLAFHFTFRLFRPVNITAVPWAKSAIPFVGNVLEYGADPVKFLLRQRELLGDVFRVNLVIMSITFCIGPQVSGGQLQWKTSTDKLSTAVESVAVLRDLGRRTQPAPDATAGDLRHHRRTTAPFGMGQAFTENTPDR